MYDDIDDFPRSLKDLLRLVGGITLVRAGRATEQLEQPQGCLLSATVFPPLHLSLGRRMLLQTIRRAVIQGEHRVVDLWSTSVGGLLNQGK